MQDDLLRQQTASERLTLEQEYLMQQEWMKDDNSKFHCQAYYLYFKGPEKSIFHLLLYIYN